MWTLIFILLFVFCGTIGLVEALETGIVSTLRPVSPFHYCPDLRKKYASASRTSNCSPWLRMSNDRATVPGSFIEKGLKWLLRRNAGKSGGALGGGDDSNLDGALPTLKSSVVEVVETDPVITQTSNILSRPLPVNTAIHRGALPNGLKYIILKNQSPPERFEAHLEIFAGSANEQDSQQGMAHLVEHVAYMGSRKREKLFGTGSQTNAYTDFHHTVFFASCPTLTPSNWGGKNPMMPLALDALCDVLEAQCEETRLEKERSAVLSEMSMVNTIEYRVECQILSALHSENQLSRRFPIGLRNLIESWQVVDIKQFISTHYRPDNAMLYVLGDITPEKVEKQIQETFSHLRPGKKERSSSILRTLKSQSVHYPPVSHRWCGGRITSSISLPVMKTVDDKPMGTPRLFHHPLVQPFSLHLFAKRPVEPLLTHDDLRRSIMKRIALAVLQVRLSVNSRTEPLFTSIEFNQVPSPREGCEVCYLDLTAHPSKWKECIKVAIREIRRLGKFGISKTELKRFKQALLTDSQQLAAQYGKISNADYLPYLMDAVSNGHTFMDTQQAYDATCLAVKNIDQEGINQIAAEITDHVTNYGIPTVPEPSAIVACAPDNMRNEVTEYSLLAAIKKGVNEEIKESLNFVVPSSLISPQALKGMVERFDKPWAPFIDRENKRLGETKPKLCYRDSTTGVLQRRLTNGMHVNIKTFREEAKRGMLRITMPGGRQLEQEFGQGTVAVGARTMLEGGAFAEYQREVVELFCIDHLITILVDANEETLHLDFLFPTTKLHTKEGEEVSGPDELSGSEAAMQVIHKILTGYVWEEDALNRAKMSFVHMYDTMTKSLESFSLETLLSNLTGKDGRFLFVPSKKVEDMTVGEVRKAIVSQLTTDVMEISLVGDFEEDEVQDLVTQYLATVPASSRDPVTAPDMESIPSPSMSHVDKNIRRHTEVHLEDSDERSIAYVAGSAPNRWGRLRDGVSVVDLMNQAESFSSANVLQRRSHSLFPYVALELLKEVVNRRLFSTVREQKRLTYDANFHISPFDRLQGSWYLMTVTANPSNAEAALQACKDTLHEMSTIRPVTFDNVESAKRVLINRHESGTRTLQYWVELMSGLQGPAVPFKDMSCIRDFINIVHSVTTKDLQLLLTSAFCTRQDEMLSCIGCSGSRPMVPSIPAVAAEP